MSKQPPESPRSATTDSRKLNEHIAWQLKTSPQSADDESAPKEGPWVAVCGRVVGPDGQPVPRAKLTLLGRNTDSFPVETRDVVLLDTVAATDGQFRLVVPRLLWSETDVLWLAVEGPPELGPLMCLVPVPEPDTPNEVLVRTAFASDLVSGRILGPDGRPLAGAQVRVVEFQGSRFEAGPREQLPSYWPPPTTTDTNGRFVLHANGASTVAFTAIHDDRGLAGSRALSWNKKITPTTDLRLSPRRTITGRVLAEGKPVEDEDVIVRLESDSGISPLSRTRTKADGRFSINVFHDIGWRIRAEPDPALALIPEQKWINSKSYRTNETAIEFNLSRGIRVTGRVLDDRTGRPIAGAHVQYVRSVLGGNPFDARQVPTTDTDTAGRFTLIVPIQPAIRGQKDGIAVTARNPMYLTPNRKSANNGSYEWWKYVHTAVVLPDDLSKDLTVQLTPGTTVRCYAKLPDGSPLADGVVWCKHTFGSSPGRTLSPIPVRNGHFEIVGCRRGQDYEVTVTDRAGRYGAEVVIKSDKALAEIQLAPLRLSTR